MVTTFVKFDVWEEAKQLVKLCSVVDHSLVFQRKNVLTAVESDMHRNVNPRKLLF